MFVHKMHRPIWTRPQIDLCYVLPILCSVRRVTLAFIRRADNITAAFRNTLLVELLNMVNPEFCFIQNSEKNCNFRLRRLNYSIW